MSSAPASSTAARHHLARRLNAAVAGEEFPRRRRWWWSTSTRSTPTPSDLVRRAAGKPVRVASKSLRIPALLQRALAVPGFAGVLAYSLREALWLVHEGITDDAVMGYPSVDRGALRDLLADADTRSRVTLMVDDPAHLALVEACGEVNGVRVAIDIDAGLRMGRSHVGPKRSPLHDTSEVVAFAQDAIARGFSLVGVMTYEGQVAGVPDDVPNQRARSSSSASSRRPRSHSSRSDGPRSRRACARWSTWSSGTPAARAASSPPWPTRSSPRSRPVPGCWSPACSTTTRASTRGRRLSTASPSYADPAAVLPPWRGEDSSPAARPARTGCRSRGRRPTCT